MVDLCYGTKSSHYGQSMTHTFERNFLWCRVCLKTANFPKLLLFFLRCGQIWVALTQFISHQNLLWSQLEAEMV